MTIFDGVGLWVWEMPACAGGNVPESEAARQHMLTVMQLAGARWAAPKVSNGVLPFNRSGNTYNGADTILPKFYELMTKSGYPRLGWQYIYGNLPIQEAEVAAAQIKKYDLQGFLLDPEGEYQVPAKATAAVQYMSHLRSLCPDVPLAMASYRFPSLHPIPWASFLNSMDASLGDVWMPQMYWEGDNSLTGPGTQLRQCVTEILALKKMPVLPIGSAYGNRQNVLTYWLPTAAQIENFAGAAKVLNLPGISWWAWDTMVAKDAVSPAQLGKYGWWASVAKTSAWWQTYQPPEPPTPQPEPVTLEQRVTALEMAARAHSWKV